MFFWICSGDAGDYGADHLKMKGCGHPYAPVSRLTDIQIIRISLFTVTVSAILLMKVDVFYTLDFFDHLPVLLPCSETTNGRALGV